MNSFPIIFIGSVHRKIREHSKELKGRSEQGKMKREQEKMKMEQGGKSAREQGAEGENVEGAWNKDPP